MPSSVSPQFQLQLSLNSTQSQLNWASTQTTKLGTTQLILFSFILICYFLLCFVYYFLQRQQAAMLHSTQTTFVIRSRLVFILLLIEMNKTWLFSDRPGLGQDILVFSCFGWQCFYFRYVLLQEPWWCLKGKSWLKKYHCGTSYLFWIVHQIYFYSLVNIYFVTIKISWDWARAQPAWTQAIKFKIMFNQKQGAKQYWVLNNSNLFRFQMFWTIADPALVSNSGIFKFENILMVVHRTHKAHLHL